MMKVEAVRSFVVRAFEVRIVHDETHARSQVLRRAFPRYLQTESKWRVLHRTVMQLKSGDTRNRSPPIVFLL
jgi:hypothetical protein